MNSIVTSEGINVGVEYYSATTEVAERLLMNVPETDGMVEIRLAGITQPETNRINPRLVLSRQRLGDVTTYYFGDELGRITMGATWDNQSTDIHSFIATSNFEKVSTSTIPPTNEYREKIFKEINSSVPFDPEVHIVLNLPIYGNRIVHKNVISRLGQFLGL